MCIYVSCNAWNMKHNTMTSLWIMSKHGTIDILNCVSLSQYFEVFENGFAFKEIMRQPKLTHFGGDDSQPSVLNVE